jgi:hemerythrin-like domain-containing protein
MQYPALQIMREEHATLAAVLRSLSMLLDMGPRDEPERFFDVLRAMLFYIDEFPERLHHPKESEILFPRLVRVAPQLRPLIETLERDHAQGEKKVRELQHLLLAWELIGESRRLTFEQAAKAYVSFYLQHMRTEEVDLFPVAQQLLADADWNELNAAFAKDRDPFAGGHRPPCFDRLFTRIVTATPAPIGVGRSFDGDPVRQHESHSPD